jgi:hypothetical protein
MKPVAAVVIVVALVAVAIWAQRQAGSPDVFPQPLEATRDIVKVSFSEFAKIPEVGGEAARMMLLIDEPGTRRMFVNDMRGPLYSVSYDGKTVTQYLDINATTWDVRVQSSGSEQGFQSFAFHPQFARSGTAGYGKFYTFTDTSNMAPTADFMPLGGNHTHHTVLLEWTAKNPGSATYDGGAPREMMRFEQPYTNHNAGMTTFNPLAAAGTPEFGLLYITFGDGGSGGDPHNMAQDRSSAFGKILRINPLGNNSPNHKYGIPASNPYANDNESSTLGEIFASGVRNAQRIAWDPKNGNMFAGDIGQGTVEEVSLVTASANLGWNKWEGSFGFLSRRSVSLTNQRGDPAITYPVAEYDHDDPLLQSQVAITLGYVYRQRAIPQLANLLLFGDMPSGEIFYLNADNLPKGGQDSIRRVLFNDRGSAKTLLQLIQAKNAQNGKPAARRADLRFGMGPEGQIFILDKGDGIVRLLTPDQP